MNEQAKCSTNSEGPSGVCWICAGKHFLPQGDSRVQWLWKRPWQFRKAALPLLVGLYTSCLASRGFPLFICKWGTVLRLEPQKQTLRQILRASHLFGERSRSPKRELKGETGKGEEANQRWVKEPVTTVGHWGSVLLRTILGVSKLQPMGQVKPTTCFCMAFSWNPHSQAPSFMCCL